jgi:hypothetical protein
MRRLDSLHERVDVLRRASGRIVDRHLAAQREVAAKLLANQQILDSVRTAPFPFDILSRPFSSRVAP